MAFVPDSFGEGRATARLGHSPPVKSYSNRRVTYCLAIRPVELDIARTARSSPMLA
jgi:hypothetical protein